MNNANFIITLMKTETDALGFIPAPSIRTRWIPNGRFILQRNRHGRRVGYLLHGPPKIHRPLFVNQICVDIDDRLRKYAAAAVLELLARARSAGASSIRLRCAEDLDANLFWRALGFTPTHLSVGGKRRKRSIVHYKLTLEPEAEPPRRPKRRRSAWSGYWPGIALRPQKRPLSPWIGPSD